jgi:outer membrane protein
MKSLRVMAIWVMVTVITAPVFAQKFAYVQSQKILAEYQEYVDVQTKLNEIKNTYEQEYKNKVQEYQKMAEEIDSQSLLLSPEKKQEKMRQAQEMAVAIEKYKYEKLGPEGELYQKSVEFTKPIIDKINKLIEQVGNDEGYDMIFDASSGSLVHALPKYDISDIIIEKLNKTSGSK